MSILCRRQAHSSTIPQGKAVFPILLMDVWRDDVAWCDCWRTLMIVCCVLDKYLHIWNCFLNRKKVYEKAVWKELDCFVCTYGIKCSWLSFSLVAENFIWTVPNITVGLQAHIDFEKLRMQIHILHYYMTI